MEKTALSTPPKSKSFNYFVYEMKDTNQLLKDLISCNMSDTMSRSAENKQQAVQHESFRDSRSRIKEENTEKLEYKNITSQFKFSDSSIFNKQLEDDFVKYQDSYQHQQNEFFVELKSESHHNIKNKKQHNQLQDLILQKFYVDMSENQEAEESNKLLVQKYKGKEIDSKNLDQHQSAKEIKKQKKGLANISLRVKNIVSEHKKLSYKQVSDLVLQYSREQIDQLSESQKVKQIKNIKRRVYDALNVLVAMGILGKHQRCVCNTEWTNIPGKKHSIQWQNINNKIDYISKLKRSCVDKAHTLKSLIDKYNAIAALRNKHRIEEKSIKSEQKEEQSSSKTQNKYVDKKLMFPVITFCSSLDQQNDKLTVEMEQTQQNESRMRISGKNIIMFGDLDCALQLDLEKYRDQEQQKKLENQMNEYARQQVKNKFPTSKIEAHHIHEANIEDYFN